MAVLNVMSCAILTLKINDQSNRNKLLWFSFNLMLMLHFFNYPFDFFIGFFSVYQ
jgi:hypothetical protein